MANEEQLAILLRGNIADWNHWRMGHLKDPLDFSEADLRGKNLHNANLINANLREADLRGAVLSGAELYNAFLNGADLRGANLASANLKKADLKEARLGGYHDKEKFVWLNRAMLVHKNSANLYWAKLEGADLRNAVLEGVHLTGAFLSGAKLEGADLSRTDLSYADLSNADLSGANLSCAILVQANVSNAIISKSRVYGISVWDLKGKFKEQKDLIVTREKDLPITVDNIKIAQFVYLILNNKEIRDVIDTVTTKAVLILGRFYKKRKQVLDALKEALRERGFVPILFDFKPSKRRDLTETIQLLANMAKFVIADITDAKSIPQELSHIIPLMPSVPIQPILLISKEKEYAMFEHWRYFKTVLPEFLYRDKQDLLDNLESKILQPIDAWRKDQDEISVLKERIKELEAKKR